MICNNFFHAFYALEYVKQAIEQSWQMGWFVCLGHAQRVMTVLGPPQRFLYGSPLPIVDVHWMVAPELNRRGGSRIWVWRFRPRRSRLNPRVQDSTAMFMQGLTCMRHEPKFVSTLMLFVLRSRDRLFEAKNETLMPCPGCSRLAQPKFLHYKPPLGPHLQKDKDLNADTDILNPKAWVHFANQYTSESFFAVDLVSQPRPASSFQGINTRQCIIPIPDRCNYLGVRTRHLGPAKDNHAYCDPSKRG